MWRFYAEADIYLQTPEIDNMPTSVLEAFASGCVVVSTAAGGVPTILTDGVHGHLVPCGDAEAAAERVITLLENPDHARHLAANARNTCEGTDGVACEISGWLGPTNGAVSAEDEGWVGPGRG